ncbi:hypothetical protein 10S7_4 [uncultured Caudovirales phage]|uniref:Phage head morphogenesis domain-containing protein n=1 Tax=uncultured Caudovirales phage TaxID=2100421 RepID=A0A2H4JHL0_9CAUD|nr:hypothetical protein 10S7_4 [uncultured Caudovirales phage]
MDGLIEALTTNEIKFEEAVQYFGEKLVLTPKQFYELSDKYRSLAFTVGGYTKIQTLKKFHDELLRAIEDGLTMEQFKNEMNTFLESKGYEGLSNFQADNIFRTNVQTAYQVGHYEQMTSPMVKKLRPYWQYDAVNDSHTRPSHLAMNGKVFPCDSPIWDTWYPPNGFRCRCSVQTLSKRQVEERGLKVEKEVPTAAELEGGRFVNILPDPNFSTNPAKARFKPDLEGYPESLKKAYQKQQKQE